MTNDPNNKAMTIEQIQGLLDTAIDKLNDLDGTDSIIHTIRNIIDEDLEDLK